MKRARRNTKSLGIVDEQASRTRSSRAPKTTGIRRRTLRADPPPPSARAPLPFLTSDRSGETKTTHVVRNLALLSDPLSVPVLRRALMPEDALGPQEAYVASLLGETMTVQAILDVSPMDAEATLRFLSRLVSAGLVTIASMRARR